MFYLYRRNDSNIFVKVQTISLVGGGYFVYSFVFDDDAKALAISSSYRSCTNLETLCGSVFIYERDKSEMFILTDEIYGQKYDQVC